MPASVKSAYVSIAGGGSGSYAGYPRLISGASGGYLVSYPLNLTPGEVIAITIGAGGSENTAGGTTTFGSYISCSGGYAPSGWTYTVSGNCGSLGGVGNPGQFVGVGNLTSNSASYGGHLSGGVTPLYYGSGGYGSMSWGGATSGGFPIDNGIQGVVFVDVLY